MKRRGPGRAAPDAPAPGRSFARILQPVVLILAVVLAYSGGLGGPFVFDDSDTVVNNPTIRSFATAFAPPQADGATVSGRPVVNASLALNFAVGGLEVTGYHVANLAFHAAAVLLVFGVTRRLFARIGGPLNVQDDTGRTYAFLVALAWGLHPLQTSAVTYVSQRAELLATLFLLLTLYSFLRHADRRDGAGPAWAVAAVCACLLGMASKEVMAAAPLLVLLADRAFVSGSFTAAFRRHRVLHAGLALTWILLLWLALGTEGRGRTAGFNAGVSPFDYLLTQCWAIGRYLQLAVWPRPLVFDYGIELHTGITEVLLPGIVLLALLGCTVVALVRNRPIGFAGAVFFGVLAPSSSLVPVATQVAAEHRMYLPLVVLVTLAVLAIGRSAGRWMIPAGLAWAVALGGATMQRNIDYRSEEAIWADTVAKMPTNGRAFGNLGKALSELGREQEAVVALEEAVRLRPDLASAHYNLGLIRYEAGQIAAAERHYLDALAADPSYGSARLNLAVILLQRGELALALPELERAVGDSPGLVEAWVVLGNTLAQLGRLDEAELRHREAVRLAPQLANAHYNLGNVLFQMRRSDEAMAAYRTSLELEPANAFAHYYLGIILLGDDRVSEGIAELRAALAIDPRLQPARELLDRALAAEAQTASP
jgi:tetratricopeptide (TPR) repeat protein